PAVGDPPSFRSRHRAQVRRWSSGGARRNPASLCQSPVVEQTCPHALHTRAIGGSAGPNRERALAYHARALRKRGALCERLPSGPRIGQSGSRRCVVEEKALGLPARGSRAGALYRLPGLPLLPFRIDLPIGSDGSRRCHSRASVVRVQAGEPLTPRTSVYSCSTAWTKLIAIEPSPTAEATRLTLPHRTSPTANTPGRLVS